MSKKTIHYSRQGYEGKYLYNTVCGKSVKTHQDNEESSVHPKDATCKFCISTIEYKTDLADFDNTAAGIKRRIYIESDILQADEFRDAQRSAFDFAKKREMKCVDRIFSDVLDFAWHDLETTWQAVKDADEIYATSSLMPLSGGSYMGAPVIFNGMCERALKENITGKSVVIFNQLKYINWYMIKIDVMKRAFKENNLFMFNDKYELACIDVSKIKS